MYQPKENKQNSSEEREGEHSVDIVLMVRTRPMHLQSFMNHVQRHYLARAIKR